MQNRGLCENTDFSGRTRGREYRVIFPETRKCTVDIGEGKCLIQYTVDLLKSRGIRDIRIVLGYKSQVIRDVLEGRRFHFSITRSTMQTNSIASALVCQGFSRRRRSADYEWGCLPGRPSSGPDSGGEEESGDVCR